MASAVEALEGSRCAIQTEAPDSARARARTAPIPRLPPVMRAVCPFREKSSGAGIGGVSVEDKPDDMLGSESS